LLTDMLQKRDSCDTEGILVMTLNDGVLLDSKNRTGYIASNNQFQFDDPPQAGALQTSGFSICDGSLALSGNTIWYQCLSGDFYNLYDTDTASYCDSVTISIMGCGSENTATVLSDGQVVGTSTVETTIVTAISDGQPQVHTTTVAVPMCQIGDGQVQVQTTPCASITAVATTTAVPVSQYSDGQIQVTTVASTTAAPVSQYSDGQVQVTTASSAAPVSQYSDGQVQVTTESTAAAGTTISPVTESAPATTATATPSYSNSTIAATTAASSTAATTAATSTTAAPPTSGAANLASGSVLALVAGLLFACL
jgi:hypothetical protein